MIVELRTYKIRPGFRERFLRFFQDSAGPVQRSKGMQLLGPFIDPSNEQNVFYLRGFRNGRERDRIRALFYQGSEWENELRTKAMALVESYSVVLGQTGARWFKFDEPAERVASKTSKRKSQKERRKRSRAAAKSRTRIR